MDEISATISLITIDLLDCMSIVGIFRKIANILHFKN